MVPSRCYLRVRQKHTKAYCTVDILNETQWAPHKKIWNEQKRLDLGRRLEKATAKQAFLPSFRTENKTSFPFPPFFHQTPFSFFFFFKTNNIMAASSQQQPRILNRVSGFFMHHTKKKQASDEETSSSNSSSDEISLPPAPSTHDGASSRVDSMFSSISSVRGNPNSPPPVRTVRLDNPVVHESPPSPPSISSRKKSKQKLDPKQVDEAFDRLLVIAFWESLLLKLRMTFWYAKKISKNMR